MKNCLTIIILFSVPTLMCTDETPVNYLPHLYYQTYEGVPLNTKTVGEFAYSQTFKIKDFELLAWLKKNKKMLTALATYIVFDNARNFKKGIRRGNRLLKRYGLSNSALFNFIFPITVGSNHKKYWIKVAGPHRLVQLYQKLTQLGESLHTKKGRRVMRSKPTYQNASRFARYLLYKKWKQNNPTIPLKVPTTYLFTFSESLLLDDTYCIIIEEEVTSRDDNHARIIELLSAIKAAMTDFIIHLGLWDFNNINQFKVAESGELFYMDIEDRHSTNPDEFFQGDYDMVKNNIDYGLNGFHRMLGDKQRDNSLK